METRRRRIERGVLVAAAVVSVLAPGLASAGVHPPGRTLLAVLFVLLVPGAPVAVLLRLADPLVAVALGLATSLASWLVLSTALLTAGAWNAAAVAWVLAGLAQALLLLAWPLTAPPTGELLSALAPQRAVTPRPPEAFTGIGGWIVDAAPRVLPVVALAGAVELWVWATTSLDLDKVGASGAIGIVGPAYVLSLCLIATVIGWALREEDPDTLVMTAAIVSLVVVLFGLLNVADSAGGFRTAWIHVGFIDYISRHGATAVGYDARFSWPGFFAAGAAVVHLAGLHDAAPLIRWAPVVYNLLALPALLVIGRAVTGSRRTSWLGVVLYLCFNWFSQDYLSPQATVLLLYVGVIAVLLTTTEPAPVVAGALRTRLLAQLRSEPRRPEWLSAQRALAVEAVLAVIVVATAISHQLTPVALTGVLLAFAISRSTRFRLLWVVSGLAFLAWFSFGAEDFWRGHLGTVFGDVGKLGNTIGVSVGDRLRGNPVHGRMQQVRLLWAASSLGLAALGLWRLRTSSRALLAAALAFGPFGLLAVQSYGGEVALRCFVYAGPALGPLAAVAVLWGLDAVAMRPAVLRSALPAVVLVASLVLTATRGANAGFERVTSTQLVVAGKLLEAMPAHSRIGLLADAGPLGFERLTDFEEISLAPDVCGSDIVRCVRRNHPDYVYVTSTMDVLGQLQFGQPPGWTQRTVDDLIRLHLYRRLASERDALVLGRVAPKL